MPIADEPATGQVPSVVIGDLTADLVPDVAADDPTFDQVPDIAAGPRRRCRARPALGIGLWLLWLASAAWAAARFAGREGGALLPVQLLAFTPYVALGAVPLPVAALLVRRWRLAAVATATAAALAGCILPRALADAQPAAGDGPRLRVLTTNMLVGRADAATIVRLVRSERVDLLAVQELTTDGELALDAAGLAGALPHRVAYTEPHLTGLFSRYPLRDGAVRVLDSAFGQAVATLTVPGAAPVAVESVHSCAPVGGGADRWWAADLNAQPPATVDGRVRLLLGDFNATLDHAPLRRLLATGYRDAGDVRGAGLIPTWPADGRRLPGVTIDHVLADRRVGILDYRVYTVPRTDHRAVYAELVLPVAPTTVGYPSQGVSSR